MSKLFKDVVNAPRSRTYPTRVSDEEIRFLQEEARKRGIRVVTLVRRCLRLALIERPEVLPPQ